MTAMMQIGQLVLGRYRIEDLIQEGGQASVARAVDESTGAWVAVRRLTASPGQSHYPQELARFRRAAELRIGHPAVVDPIDAGEEDGEAYMICPFIEGKDLEAYVAGRGGRLAVHRAVPIIDDLADGLEAIHTQGIIHRDLKPANILIDADDRPHILDFGICRNLQETTITQGSGLLGSLHYMSPEQIVHPGSEDHRSDLYALGAVLYFMVAGRPPVQGDDPGQIAVSICQWTPPSLVQIDSSVPAYVDQACMRLLAKQPDARPQSAAEFRRALQGTGQPGSGQGFCRSCGTQVLTGAVYCYRCGAECHADTAAAIHCLACGTVVAEAVACPNCRRRFSRPGHRLEFRTGSLTGRVFRVPEGIYDVGREQLAPRDHYISRRQFRVACSNGSVHVEDASSTNRTYVAGQLADHPVQLAAAQELWLAGNSAIYVNQ